MGEEQDVRMIENRMAKEINLNLFMV